MCRRPRHSAARLALLTLAWAASGCAADPKLPPIAGHLTDPGHRLSDSAHGAIEGRLGKIADETHVDVAGWISEAPEDQADALGKAAYKSWNIGAAWDSGLFFVFPTSGRGHVHVLQDEGRPILSPAELASLAAADDPGADLATRIGRLADVARGLVAPKPRVPGINGHLTDPGRRLTDAEKRGIEDRLTKLAEDTHIDVAGWLTDASEERVASYGDEAYRRWKIGVYWDNGIFFAFPASGRVRLIQEPARPELSPTEADQLVAVDDPRQGAARRIERLTDAARALLVPKTRHRPRPPGQADPERGNFYLLGTLAVALAGIGLSLRRREPSPTSPWLLAIPDGEELALHRQNGLEEAPIDPQPRVAARKQRDRRSGRRRRGH